MVFSLNHNVAFEDIAFDDWKSTDFRFRLIQGKPTYLLLRLIILRNRERSSLSRVDLGKSVLSLVHHLPWNPQSRPAPQLYLDGTALHADAGRAPSHTFNSDLTSANCGRRQNVPLLSLLSVLIVVIVPYFHFAHDLEVQRLNNCAVKEYLKNRCPGTRPYFHHRKDSVDPFMNTVRLGFHIYISGPLSS